ncbi:inhibitor of growth protein 4-like [Apostichopus japonicus]|uniref:inhibitor of growth protein 4-like n=1 Tax=Stichopus japonicus TaxID=307972 RepID=UPI003AB26591
MANALYLEQYLDSIENLPFELQRNFTLMRDLDQRTQDLASEIDGESADYLKNVKNLNPEQRASRLTKINAAFAKSREYGDDKVQLAMQTYEMVDKHIRRLDAELQRFEEELKERHLEQQQASAGGFDDGTRDKKKKAGREKKLKNARGRPPDDETPRQKKKMKGAAAASVDPPPMPITPILSVASVINGPSDVLDMPVDPNEPTYCLCHQVSYGEMIGCDNPDCPIEWFHFACVGLATKPKGKWFCPKCMQDRKKK